MAEMVTTADLAPFAEIPEAKAHKMIKGAVATARVIAPCLKTMDPEADEYEAAKALIVGAILRWHDSGSGASVQLGAGPFQQTLDTRQVRRGMYWPSEIAELQKLCKSSRAQAFTIDTTPPGISRQSGAPHNRGPHLREFWGDDE